MPTILFTLSSTTYLSCLDSLVDSTHRKGVKTLKADSPKMKPSNVIKLKHIVILTNYLGISLVIITIAELTAEEHSRIAPSVLLSSNR